MKHPYERPSMKQHLRLQVRKLSEEEGDDEDGEEGQEAHEEEKPK